jgi:hypothetical protein
VIGGTLHYGGSWPTNYYQGSSFTFPTSDSTTNFHVYSLEWTTNAFRWYVDGRLFRTQTSWWSSGGAYPAPFDQPFFIVMNLAVGGNYGGNPDATTVFQGVMEVDYVRVYDYSPTAAPQLRLEGSVLSGGSFIISGSNGPPEATFYIFSTTNAGSGIGDWKPFATNQFDAAGKFTCSIPIVSPASLYRVQVP